MLELSTITTTIIFLLTAMSMGVLLAISLRLLFKVLLFGFRLLSNFKWFRDFTQYIISKSNQYWSVINLSFRAKLPNIINFLEYNFEVFGDVVVLGFVIGLGSERISDIQTFADSNPQYNVFQILEADMNLHPLFWTLLAIMICFWVFGKARKYLIEKTNTKTNKTILSDMSIRLERLDTNIDTMSKNIKQNTKQLNRLDKTLNKLTQLIEEKGDEL